jgi:hypothetical protein
MSVFVLLIAMFVGRWSGFDHPRYYPVGPERGKMGRVVYQPDFDGQTRMAIPSRSGRALNRI